MNVPRQCSLVLVKEVEEKVMLSQVRKVER
jgi:hypothetical protein